MVLDGSTLAAVRHLDAVVDGTRRLNRDHLDLVLSDHARLRRLHEAHLSVTAGLRDEVDRLRPRVAALTEAGDALANRAAEAAALDDDLLGAALRWREVRGDG